MNTIKKYKNLRKIEEKKETNYVFLNEFHFHYKTTKITTTTMKIELILLFYFLDMKRVSYKAYF